MRSKWAFNSSLYSCALLETMFCNKCDKLLLLRIFWYVYVIGLRVSQIFDKRTTTVGLLKILNFFLLVLSAICDTVKVFNKSLSFFFSK